MKIAIIAYAVAALVFLAGWVMNFMAVVHAVTTNAPFTPLLIARIAGIPVGVLGAALGWF